MIRLPDLTLDADTTAALRGYQQSVNAVADYPGRVEAAKSEFKKRNTATNATFRAVRAKLAEMCSGARRCAYCEDSVADEVEHIAPKTLFPELTFDWFNYVYACGPCNGPKSNRWEVLDHRGELVVIIRERDAVPEPPPPGTAVLVNPRSEHPERFLELDLRETFLFVPTLGLSRSDELRARRTLDILGLNRRDYLAEARRAAFDDYNRHLEAYVQRKAEAAPTDELARRASSIARRQHPTVWHEMRRQRDRYAHLRRLFGAAPEALTW